MTLEAQVAALTTATTDLLEACNFRKGDLDGLGCEQRQIRLNDFQITQAPQQGREALLIN